MSSGRPKFIFPDCVYRFLCWRLLIFFTSSDVLSQILIGIWIIISDSTFEATLFRPISIIKRVLRKAVDKELFFFELWRKRISHKAIVKTTSWNIARSKCVFHILSLCTSTAGEEILYKFGHICSKPRHLLIISIYTFSIDDNASPTKIAAWLHRSEASVVFELSWFV